MPVPRVVWRDPQSGLMFDAGCQQPAGTEAVYAVQVEDRTWHPLPPRLWPSSPNEPMRFDA